MPAIAKRIASAYAARKSRRVHVPEWDLDLHIFPITLGQLSRINEETDPMRRVVRAICTRAKTEKGEPLFDAEDAEAMFAQGVGAFGPDVLMRVCAEIGIEEQSDDEAAAEKN